MEWRKRMTENLIKRYLLEKAYEEGKEEKIISIGEKKYQDMMFDLLIREKMMFDESDFEYWLKTLKVRKTIFGSYIKEQGYLADDDKMIEVTEDSNISCINGLYLFGKNEKIIETVGDSYCTKPSLSAINGHLIIDGMYANELIYLARSCANGSFTIGYYGDRDSLYTKRVISYYKKLKTVLRDMTNNNCEVVEDSILNKNKIYVLNYKSTPTKR